MYCLFTEANSEIRAVDETTGEKDLREGGRATTGTSCYWPGWCLVEEVVVEERLTGVDSVNLDMAAIKRDSHFHDGTAASKVKVVCDR